MKIRFVAIVIFVGMLNAGFGKFIKEASNPNGEPFMMSVGVEKNVHSFKYYDQSTFYVTLPVSNIVTLKYRENVTYQEDMALLQSEHDMIDCLDKHYSLELHLPLYKLWK